MAGHSKWANTKHRKAAQDAKKNKIFSTIAKDIMIAAKSGGDPAMNPRLRTAIQKAKQANMPNDKIAAAIKKGSGEDGGAELEELLYEGYATGGVGFIVEVTTDNKNRSASEVRSTFSKNNGELAKPGALAFNFQRKGQVLIAADQTTEDALMELMLEAGADDINNNGDHFEVLCEIADYDTVVEVLDKAGIETESSELAYLPNSTQVIDTEDVAKQILRLEDRLDELEDVKAVWSNYEMPEPLIDQIRSA
jgi:YebC/PmpR family DNA-binding regulatory protein